METLKRTNLTILESLVREYLEEDPMFKIESVELNYGICLAGSICIFKEISNLKEKLPAVRFSYKAEGRIRMYQVHQDCLDYMVSRGFGLVEN